MSRRHNDLNILCLSADMLGERLIDRMVEVRPLRKSIGEPKSVAQEFRAQGRGDERPNPPGQFARDQLAEQHRIPAVWGYRRFVVEGALASYGPDTADIFRRSASYVDRILKGAKPADLPAQVPIKYELAINLKTAKALGLTIPPQLFARADEVIE